MGYQVLARKWRPKTFDELAGQEHVLKALVNALQNQRLHHAYLFTGTRGVGKTTIARILARSLNCETGITASPCGTCSACQEINEGRFVDLIEVDAASRTKVEDTRDLLENIQYRPARGRYKIYLIDEVHMLSTHSFNALLKTLEEPPEHVKFLLATTDPQKLPVTVLSRCLQFNLKNLTSSRIQEYLQFVLGEEKVPAEAEALWHLARAARGSMRDALSLTDQAISHGGGKLSEADVVTMLGTVDRKRIYELMDGLVSSDAEKVLGIATSLAEFSPDYFALVEDMLVLMHSVAVYQRIPRSSESQKSEGFEEEKLASYAQQFSPEDVQLIYQMLLMGSKDLKVTPDLHMGFEMLLLRLIAFQPAREGEVFTDETPTDQTSTDQISTQEGSPAKKSEAVLEEHLEQSSVQQDSAATTEPPPEILATEQEVQPEVAAIPAIPEQQTESPVATLEAGDETAAEADRETESIGSTGNIEGIENTGNIENIESKAAEASTAEQTNSSQSNALESAGSKINGAQPPDSQPTDSQPPDSQPPGAQAEYVDEVPVFDESVYSANENMDTSAVVETEELAEIRPGLCSEEEHAFDEEGKVLDVLKDEDAGPAPKTLKELNTENWIALFRNLPLNGMVRTLCAHLVVVENSNNGLVLNLAEPGQKVFEPSHKEKFEHTLSDYFGEPVNTQISMDVVDRETPAEYAERRYQEKLVEAEKSILQSPLVQKLVEEFQAELVPGSVHLNTIETQRR